MSTHTSDANERRLKIARTVYDALVAQNPDRQITLCDGSGRLLARNERRPNEAITDSSRLRPPPILPV
jgi:hypothetical protein